MSHTHWAFNIHTYGTIRQPHPTRRQIPSVYYPHTCTCKTQIVMTGYTDFVRSIIMIMYNAMMLWLHVILGSDRLVWQAHTHTHTLTDTRTPTQSTFNCWEWRSARRVHTYTQTHNHTHMLTRLKKMRPHTHTRTYTHTNATNKTPFDRETYSHLFIGGYRQPNQPDNNTTNQKQPHIQ